jgi:hypothetical protein
MARSLLPLMESATSHREEGATQQPSRAPASEGHCRGAEGATCGLIEYGRYDSRLVYLYTR